MDAISQKTLVEHSGVRESGFIPQVATVIYIDRGRYVTLLPLRLGCTGEQASNKEKIIHSHLQLKNL